MEMDRDMVEVWGFNFDSEIIRFFHTLRLCRFVAVDTEFTGFLRITPRDGSETERFEDFRFNMDRMNLTQMGFTLFDDNGNVGGTWQFNFRERPGVNFKKNTRRGVNVEGVDGDKFAATFRSIVARCDGLRWITFHGLYDLGFMVKVVTGGAAMPESVDEFAETVGGILGSVYDVKFMARYCEGLWGGELGLERLGELLGTCRYGNRHQAGSDSLLTAFVFIKMKEVNGLITETHEGMLYGISVKMERNIQHDMTTTPPPPPPFGCLPYPPPSFRCFPFPPFNSNYRAVAIPPNSVIIPRCQSH